MGVVLSISVDSVIKFCFEEPLSLLQVFNIKGLEIAIIEITINMGIHLFFFFLSNSAFSRIGFLEGSVL